ncbi:hypothetical protein GE061_014200 [Apolygus lucorum]|uniref:Uncharacterized protein n=1 Tax=Apolygus lucorum TaxID=248454 RepID=A0A8S9XQ80_APOLU|nr:hypothetical protein GE061_014200 [Apolygus lucorum]
MDGMRLRNSKVLPPRKEEGGGDADRISVRSGGSTRTSSSKSSVLSKIEMLRAIDKQQEEARARLRAQEDSMQELREKLLLDLKTGSRSSRASRKSETSRSEDDRLKLKTMTVQAQVEPLPKINYSPLHPEQPQPMQSHFSERQQVPQDSHLAHSVHKAFHLMY